MSVCIVEMVDIDTLESLPARLSEQRNLVFVGIAVELAYYVGNKGAVGRRNNHNVLLSFYERGVQNIAAGVVVIFVVAYLVDVVAFD